MAGHPQRDERYEPPGLEGLEAEIWDLLGRGYTDRHSPFRLPVVATVDAEGLPSARTVVLRHVDRAQRLIGFHTDMRSPKVEQLRQSAAVAWVFYDPRRKIQVRAQTVASLHVQDHTALGAWRNTPDHSRACYLAPRPPSTRLATGADPSSAVVNGTPDHDHSELGWPNFAVVRCRVTSYDWLWLAAFGHRRAEIAYDPRRFDTSPKVRWLVP